MLLKHLPSLVLRHPHLQHRRKLGKALMKLLLRLNSNSRGEEDGRHLSPEGKEQEVEDGVREGKEVGIVNVIGRVMDIHVVVEGTYVSQGRGQLCVCGWVGVSLSRRPQQQQYHQSFPLIDSLIHSFIHSFILFSSSYHPSMHT